MPPVPWRGPKVGLWRPPALNALLQGAMFAAGVVLYFRSTRPQGLDRSVRGNRVLRLRGARSRRMPLRRSTAQRHRAGSRVRTSPGSCRGGAWRGDRHPDPPPSPRRLPALIEHASMPRTSTPTMEIATRNLTQTFALAVPAGRLAPTSRPPGMSARRFVPPAPVDPPDAHSPERARDSSLVPLRRVQARSAARAG